MNLREKFREAIYEDLTIRQCPTADWIETAIAKSEVY